MNTVQLIGNLTRDPERRETRSETSVVSMRIAVNGRRKNKAGDYVNKPGYFDVTVFGAQADVAMEYLAKGRKVAVSGRLDYQEWKTENGQTRSKVEVIASEVEFLSPAPKGGGENSPETAQADSEPATSTSDGSRSPRAKKEEPAAA